MKRILIWSLAVVGIVLLAIQFIPVDRSNAATRSQAGATTEQLAVLKRACFDCHSNEVVYPWYSYVAPVSWLVARDVAAGRDELNFSEWDKMSAEQQSEAKSESWEKVQSGEMPLWFYLPMHPSAKLSAADKTLLQAWATSTSTGAGTGSGTEDAESNEGAETGAEGSGGGTPTFSGSTGQGTSGSSSGSTGGTTGGSTGSATSGSTGGTTGGTGSTTGGTTDADNDNDND